MKKEHTKQIVTMAMLAALAYIAMVFIRIPVVAVPPLPYDPKDIIIIIGGFIFGPMAAFAISALVALVEMFTVSTTGWIGAVMNLVSSCSIAVTAAFIYKRNKTLQGAVLGLVTGAGAMVIVMMLWNYLLTPVYLGLPREEVAAMLPTVFLPFNLVKGGINAALTMLIYKPVVQTLRKGNLIPASVMGTKPNKKEVWMLYVVAFAILLSFIMVFLFLLNRG